MPTWIQVIIGAAALATAIGILWAKVLKPGAKLIATMENLLPVSRELVKAFKDTPEAFKVLHEIAVQFKTDSGSSLRDVVNRLETAANESRVAAEQLKVGVEATKLLSEMDRARIDRFMMKLDRLDVKVTAGAATGMRIEKAATGVADDLAAAHRRADEADGGDAGSAADAAAQLSDKEKENELK
jgi:hypothetical protein